MIASRPFGEAGLSSTAQETFHLPGPIPGGCGREVDRKRPETLRMPSGACGDVCVARSATLPAVP